MSDRLFPLFAKLSGRKVVVVGGGAMALTRVRQLVDVGANVTVVAPAIRPEVAALAGTTRVRPFTDSDLDEAWFAVAAATPEVNRAVAEAAEKRRILVNAVDDPATASVYTGGVVRRDDVTVAISTGGRAPALAGLLREALESLLPPEVGAWSEVAEWERQEWKHARIPMAERRPLLLRALNALYAPATAPSREEPRGGFVSLVGAGPGDPSLLTRLAAERLSRADVVFYDALVDPRALDLAPNAHRFHVGKRSGAPSVSQGAINRLLVREARRGKRVVRLKCGDPFVFGRGGEEAQALAAAGVPFEVVPGVSAAIAAPALAGIPVTHRGLAAGFAVLSGHDPGTYGPMLDAIAPGTMTVVVMMGLTGRAGLAGRMLERGWPSDTPAAIVLGASTEREAHWTGSLGGLASASLCDEDLDLPGTLVVGAVAGLDLRATTALPDDDHTTATPDVARRSIS